MTPPDDDELYELLNLGLALYRAGEPYEAHEAWEYAWKGEVGRTKLTLQAIIQMAAGLYKHGVGVPGGTCKLLAKALAKVAELQAGGSSWCGIDLVQLRAGLTAALAEADAVYQGRGATVSQPDLPEASSPDGILYLHGFASSPGSKKAVAIVEPLRAQGYAMHVPDQNEGDFQGLTISRAVALAKRHMFDRTLIIGSSFGGYVASLLAAKDERVKGLVLMAPAFDFASTLRRNGEKELARWRREGSVEVDHFATGEPAQIGYELFADAERQPPFPPIRVPTYILHGERDDTVPCERSRRVAGANPDSVELDVVDDEHGLVDSAPRALQAAERAMARIGLRKALPAVPPAEALERFRADPRFED